MSSESKAAVDQLTQSQNYVIYATASISFVLEGTDGPERSAAASSSSLPASITVERAASLAGLK